ncbi:MAG: hypothetical protein D3906_04660, partial [Candidatus Electrothrix sp. AUS1_2]|nr:hypothetical protein [Candidatus Electrothrix sp. AUS1_2]
MRPVTSILMEKLTAADMLNVWEQGMYQQPVQQAIMLLIAAFPDMSPDALLRLSVGQRDQLLLWTRNYLFGPKLVNTTICPECNEQIEWENKVTDFMAQTDTPDT